jgi:trigger factor
MPSVARENVGLLTDKITIKISSTEYLPAFEKKVKEYSKQMNVPGFRKGMVPTGVVKKMYGTSIFTEEILRTVEKELINYLQQEKPEIFAQPMAVENQGQALDYSKPADYEFGFEIGLKPDFALAPLQNAAVTLHKVLVTPDMLNEEIASMQVKAGNMTEPETISEEDTVVNILLTPANADGEKAEGEAGKANSAMLKYFLPAAKDALTGQAVGFSLIKPLNELFVQDTLNAILADLGVTENEAGNTYVMEVEKIGLVVKSELDEAFFEKVFPGKALKTEEEFRNHLQQDLQTYWDSQSRNQLHDQLYHYLLDNTTLEIPSDFLKRWLQQGGEKPKTAEEVEADFPNFASQLKWTLISDKITKENALDVSREELHDSMRAEVMQYFGSMNLGENTSWLDSYIDRMMQDEKQLDSTYRRLITSKLFAWAETQTTPVTKEVTGDELNALQHHHQ